MGEYSSSFDLICAWAAGFVDGEGYLNLETAKSTKLPNWTGFTIVVRVNQIDPTPLHKLALYFGGQVNALKRYENRRQAWEWRVVSLTAEKFLLLISPFLVRKKTEANLLLEARSYSGDTKNNRNRLEQIQQELKELRHKSWERA